MKIKVIFANVTHGFVYADDVRPPVGMIFRKFSIPDYVSYFKDHEPDILCLSEVLIDTSKGESEFVESIMMETGLGYCKIQNNPEESWLYLGRFYGLAILSRFPIKRYEEKKFMNPKFEVKRPNGDYWIMHDKYFQYALLEIQDMLINIFNLHYFPVHHFKKSILDLELISSKKELSNYIYSKDLNFPTIITGDFNNKKSTLEKSFPDLFAHEKLKEAIKVKTTILDDDAQLDHILLTNHFCVDGARAEKYLSDHLSLICNLSISSNGK